MADVPAVRGRRLRVVGCKRGRAIATIASPVILAVLKPTGAVLALAIVVGEMLTSAALRARDGAAWRRVGAGIAGAPRARAVARANRIGTGTFRSVGYETFFEKTPPFALSYASARLPTHLTTLLFMPPLLVAGAWPFWRTRDFGPLLVVGGYLAMMCVYVFGPTRVRTASDARCCRRD